MSKRFRVSLFFTSFWKRMLKLPVNYTMESHLLFQAELPCKDHSPDISAYEASAGDPPVHAAFCSVLCQTVKRI